MSLFKKENLPFQLKASLVFSGLVLFVIFVFTSEALAMGGRFFSKDDPVEVIGDAVTYDSKRQTYHAEGNVVVVQGPVKLRADTVVVDMETGTASAYGNVEVVSAEGDFLRGSSITIEMDEDTAVAVNARLYYKEESINIWSEDLRKTGTDTYETTGTTFTGCECEDGVTPSALPRVSPPWSFYASSSSVKVGGYFTAWNAFLYVKKLPVFYVPFIALPVKTKRQTGMLAPRIGYSDLKGSKLDNAFFWAISMNRDATFYLDLESKRGVGVGLEYRYIRAPGSYGEFFAYHFREKDLDRVREFRSDVFNLLRPLSAELDRWQLKFSHREYFGQGFALKADINIVSDDEYFIDFSESLRERSLESLESSLSLAKRWDRYNLTVQARKFDNLLLEDDSTVLQKLPEVLFTASARRVMDTPVFLSLSSALVNFERKVGVEGQRLDLIPRLSIPLRPGGLFDFTPSYLPRVTLYRVEEGLPHRSYDRGLYELRVDMARTFVRNFGSGSVATQRVAHTIRPMVRYSYVPDKNQDALPSFDPIDRVSAVNKLQYSINSTVVGRALDSGKRHRYMYLDVAQSYDIREARGKHDLDPLEELPFSDVTGELILSPLPRVSASAKGVYDVYDDWFESSDASFNVSDTRGDSLSLQYRHIRGTSRYMAGSARVAVSGALALTYRQRYTFMGDRSIEKGFSLEYAHQCFGVVVTYTDKLEDEVFMVTFSLKGIGDILKARAGLG